MRRAAVALGSNLGDRLGLLRDAVGQLRRLAAPDGRFKVASVYQSLPWQCPDGSPLFLNTVVEFTCKMEPLALFGKLRGIEQRLGRRRDAGHHAPRLIDLDLLHYSDRIWSDEQLTLPHPRIGERRFVLQPLADINPDLVLPGGVFTIEELLAMLPPDEQPLERFCDGEWA